MATPSSANGHRSVEDARRSSARRERGRRRADPRRRRSRVARRCRAALPRRRPYGDLPDRRRHLRRAQGRSPSFTSTRTPTFTTISTAIRSATPRPSRGSWSRGSRRGSSRSASGRSTRIAGSRRRGSASRRSRCATSRRAGADPGCAALHQHRPRRARSGVRPGRLAPRARRAFGARHAVGAAPDARRRSSAPTLSNIIRRAM